VSEGFLYGRTAIVTGASRGLGCEIARHFLAAGADIAICARSAANIESAAAELRQAYSGRKVVAAACDVACTGDLDRLFDVAEATFRTIDIVVNNAGIHGPIGPIDTLDWSEWKHAVAVNLTGTVYGCRRAVQHFKARNRDGRRGKIINLSGGGATAPQPGLSAYGASKAGLVRFTETLAEEVKAFAIDVNAVAPGPLATRLMHELRDAGPDKIGANYHARVAQLLNEGGMSMARPAELCVYLASARSDGITGRLISAAWDPWPFTDKMIAEIAETDVLTLRRIVDNDRGLNWARVS
jgi:NAD(P)-dependent dehydrogenase (short-subunit alcohol dehydrogenase family)